MNYFKNRAIKRMMKELPSTLRKDYGGGTTFTLGQVCAACKKHSINKKNVHFAVVLFSETTDEPEQFGEKFPDIDYQETRSYLADTFFDGNIDFKLSNSKHFRVGNSGNDSMSGGTQPPD